MTLLFLLIIQLLGCAQGKSKRQGIQPLEGIPGFNATFDYIVVGGGTAGMTVAARLAEQRLRVALVEAGEFYEVQYPISTIPGAAILGTGSNPHFKTPIDWGFVIQGSPGANSRDIHYARAKCLGGSSAINLMIYQRPSIGSMQLWADLVDDQSYTFENTLRFFKRTVKFSPPDNRNRPANASLQYNPDSFDKDGQPLHVSYPIHPGSFPSWMRLALEELGVNETRDFNSGSLLGSQYTPFTIRPSDRSRSSSESSFFEFSALQLWKLRTLTIYKITMAKRILFDSQKRATGVEVKTLGLRYILKATREVIVSAGAFQSPQLLMVSGIGPVDTLREHGIDTIVALPGVGQEMWDHVFFGPTYQVALESYSRITTDVWYLLKQVVKYITAHQGILTNPGIEYLAFEKIPDQLRSSLSPQTQKELSRFPSDWPEIEYISVPVHVGNYSNPILQPADGRQYATIAGALVAPTSRGNVTIISADTDDLPIVSPNWLSTEADQQVAVAIYKRIRDMFHSTAMSPLVVGEEYFPGMQYQSDGDILNIVRDTMMTVFHAAGTCKMGVPGDRMAVLDSRARVFGVQGLRVVDASSLPVLGPGHPQSTIYMLAEKIAADIIHHPAANVWETSSCTCRKSCVGSFDYDWI
ncbi:putative GMC oxidoreductase [Aspergillus steynii IBT 23096]|uniref:Putative GMC oxidoreductase n=1 Tax=Aspergillus steynii IBT 23096 TaxID=1392250 RepID=A0A2I2GDR2_9EURO|nr:putative GMC oxidoreductase [Aspergillus steynii IBT 23096]PLB51003.1 putative GMC oxidoreductase [Aspergillus steynii IBT 23096]